MTKHRIYRDNGVQTIRRSTLFRCQPVFNMLSACLLGLLICDCTIASSRLFINQQQGKTVSVYDAGSLDLLGRIPTIAGPTGIAIHPAAQWLAVSHPESGIISFIDSKRIIPLEHISVEGSPFGLAIADNNLFYSDWNKDIVGVISPKDHHLLGKIKVGRSPAGLLTLPCKHLLLVANRESNSISVVDTQRLIKTKDIHVGEAPFSMAYDQQFAYVVNTRSNDLSVIDLSQLSEVKRFKTGRMPYDVAVDEQRQILYVSNQLEENVSVLNARNGKLLTSIKTGAYPENIILGKGGRGLYVINWFDSTLDLYDTNSFKRLKRKQMDDGSRAFGQFIAHRPMARANDEACELRQQPLSVRQ